MKKTLVSLLSIVLIVSSLTLFVSCGEKVSSLENISVNFDSHPEFILKSSVGVSESKLEKDLVLVDVFNKVLIDFPDLSGMLDGGGNNEFVYEGAEPFFKKLQGFAEENYPKVKSMFPDITEEKFYYHTAVAYSKANHNPEIFETPYIELSSDISWRFFRRSRLNFSLSAESSSSLFF